MIRILTSLLLAIALSAVPASATERELDVHYANGDVPLAAALLLPEGRGPFPAAVIAQGSGSSDRSNRWGREFAELIVARGFAVLLTDKRGSGGSGGDWRISGFDDLAGDALAGVELLRSRPEIDPDRIGLVGLSQGGAVVPVAAARSEAVAFVVNIVGDAISFGEGSFHEMANTARQTGLEPEQVAEVLALNRAAGRYLLTGDWEPYERLRTAGLSSGWARIAEGYPTTPDAPVWTFHRNAMAFDPMPYWMLVDQPTLILYGEADDADNVAVAESARRLRFGFAEGGKTNYDLVVLPGLGHSLRTPETGKIDDRAAKALGEWLETLPSVGTE